MTNGTQRVRVEELDWSSLLPVMRLFESFRMAVHPPKLLLGLLLVLLLWLGGQVLDGLSGARVHRGELGRFAELDAVAFEAWLDGREDWTKGQLRQNLAGLKGLDSDAMRSLLDSPMRVDMAVDRIREHLVSLDERIVDADGDADDPTTSAGRSFAKLGQTRTQWRHRLGLIEAIRPLGVFDTIWEAQAGAFQRTVSAATQFHFGFGQLLRPDERDGNTVVGGLLDMAVTVPGWVCKRHCWFGLFYLIWALGVWSLLGGTICRIAALHATRDERVTTTEAMQFAFTRWGWFALTPLVPLILSVVLGLALTVGGLIFNLPVFDIAGGALFLVALLAGAGIAALMLLQVAGVHMFYPALATEGTDAFDAISRAFGYVMNRPWQWLFYTLVALVYGAITYIVIGLMVFLTVWFTQRCVGQWVIRDAAEGLNRFEAILPQIRFGQLSYDVPWSQMSLSAKTTAALVAVWVHLVFAVLGAFALSFYFSANTWVYLLLRRSCDGTEVDDVYIEEKQEPPSPVPATTDQAPSGSESDPDATAPSDGAGGEAKDPS